MGERRRGWRKRARRRMVKREIQRQTGAIEVRGRRSINGRD